MADQYVNITVVNNVPFDIAVNRDPNSPIEGDATWATGSANNTIAPNESTTLGVCVKQGQKGSFALQVTFMLAKETGSIDLVSGVEYDYTSDEIVTKFVSGERLSVGATPAPSSNAFAEASCGDVQKDSAAASHTYIYTVLPRSNWDDKEKFGVELEEISIQSPLCPVYRLQDEGDSNFVPANLKIWSAKGPDVPDPVVVSNAAKENDSKGNGTITVTVRCNYYWSFRDIPFTLVANLDGIDISPLHDTSFQFSLMDTKDPLQPGNAQVTMRFKSFAELTGTEGTENVPYGIVSDLNNLQRRLRFSLRCDPMKSSIFVGSAPVEIYLIQPSLPKDYMNYGIPAELLRLMVAPMIDAHNAKRVTSLKEYIKWTVERLHESAGDGTPVDDGLEGPIHTYRYDIWGYAPRFSDKTKNYDNQAFQLDDWLRYRKERAPFITVNCYDCASIVMATLALGISYQRIQWTFLENFGFLKSKGTKLIGWGKVNTTGSSIATGPDGAMLEPEFDSERKGFGNHAMVTLDLKPEMDKGPDDEANRLERTALDACAGPVGGQYTLEEYITECTDEPPPTVHDKPRATKNDVHLHGFLAKLQQLHHYPWAWPTDYELEPDMEDWLEKVAKFNIRNIKSTTKTVNLRAMFSQLEILLNQYSNESESADDSPTLKAIMPRAAEYSAAIWQHMGVKITVFVCRTHLDAMGWFAKQLWDTDAGHPKHTIQNSDVVPTSDGIIAVQGITDPGWFIYVHHNFFVEIEVLDPADPKAEEKGRKVTEVIDKYLANETNVIDGRKTLDITVETEKTTIEVEEVLVVTVKAPEALEVKALIHSGALYKRDMSRSGDSYTWAFHFVGQREGAEKIVFTAVHQETYEVTAHRDEINITVNLKSK